MRMGMSTTSTRTMAIAMAMVMMTMTMTMTMTMVMMMMVVMIMMGSSLPRAITFHRFEVRLKEIKRERCCRTLDFFFGNGFEREDDDDDHGKDAMVGLKYQGLKA